VGSKKSQGKVLGMGLALVKGYGQNLCAIDKGVRD